MKLENLLNLLDEDQNFQLFKNDSIGKFDKNDLGIIDYLDKQILNICVADGVLEIYLMY